MAPNVHGSLKIFGSLEIDVQNYNMPKIDTKKFTILDKGKGDLYSP